MQSCSCSSAESQSVKPQLSTALMLQAHGSLTSISSRKCRRALIRDASRLARGFLLLDRSGVVKELGRTQELKWTVARLRRLLGRLAKTTPTIRPSKKAGRAGCDSTRGRRWTHGRGWKGPFLCNGYFRIIICIFQTERRSWRAWLQDSSRS